MNRQHAGEAVALRLACDSFEPGGVAEIGMQGLNGTDARRLCRNQAERTYNLVCESKFAALVPVRCSAKRGGKVLSTPGERLKTGRRIAIFEERQHRNRRFRRNRNDTNRAFRQTMRALAFRKFHIQRTQRVGGGRFRNDDADGLCSHNGFEVGRAIGATDGIDPHPQRRASRRRFRKFAQKLACTRPVLRRNRIFQIEDQGIGVRAARLRELALAVCWHKEHGAENAAHRGLRSIRAVRLQAATISLR